MSSGSILYFCSAEYSERVAAVIAARRSDGANCRTAVSAAEARPGDVCIFVADSAHVHEFALRMELAQSLGARTQHVSMAGEEARYVHKQQAYAAFAMPETPQQFYGTWYPKLEQYALRWQPRKYNGATLGVFYLLEGGSGVGKTCAVVSVLANVIARTRQCRVFHLCPSELEAAPTRQQSADNEHDGSAAAHIQVCVHAAMEHLRKVKSRLKPADAMFIAFFDDLEEVTTKPMTAAYLAGLKRLADIAASGPRNVALVGACNNWSPLVRALRNDTLGFAVERCEIKTPTALMIAACLQQRFPRLSAAVCKRISEAASGNFRIALHMAEYGADTSDEFRTVAPADYLQSVVLSVGSQLKKSGSSAMLFSSTDRVCDIDYGDETLMANYEALVPKIYAAPALGDCELEALETIARVNDYISVADVYALSQRNSHYAGRDGVDIDNQIKFALSVTAPVIELGLATSRGEPRRGVMLDRKNAKAWECRDTIRRVGDLVLDVQPTVDVARRGGKGVQVALAISAASTVSLKRSAHANRYLPAFEAVEYLLTLGQQPYVWLRQFGLSPQRAVDVMLFSLKLCDDCERQLRKTSAAEEKTSPEIPRLQLLPVDVPDRPPARVQKAASAAVGAPTDPAPTKTQKRAKAQQQRSNKRTAASAKLTDYFSAAKKPARIDRI